MNLLNIKIPPSIFLIFLLFGCFYQQTKAQSQYNIRLHFVEHLPNQQVVYDIQLASANAKNIYLAGQNYRLYYDASKINLDQQRSYSLLDTSKYTPIRIVENYKNINATKIGMLPFDKNLGFLNLSIDLHDTDTGGIRLPASGKWMSMARLTFDKLSLAQDELYLTPADELMVWATKSLTQEYATAFVEVAEWINPKKSVPAMARTYEVSDLTLVENKSATSTPFYPVVYPNPARNKVVIEQQGSATNFDIELWTMTGQLLYKANEQQAYEIDLSNYPAGSYQVKMNNASTQLIKKIEKIK